MSALASAPAAARLRVVHYHPRALAGDGGTTLAMRQWAAGAALAGADVAVVSAPGEGRLPGVETIVVPHAGRGPTKRPHDLDRALADASVLVLHSGWVGYNERAAAAARKAGVPYVLTPHGAYYPEQVAKRPRTKRLWWVAIERRVVNRALAVHLFYDDERAHLEALGYRGEVVVAPNPVTAPAERRWIGGGGYVLWLGRFAVHRKGLDLLLHALARLSPDERPTLRMHGPDADGGRRALEKLADALDVSRWVELGDAVYGDEKWALLERAERFVYPSRYEPFGVAPGEAALLGVPTLVTPYPLGRFLAARGAALLAEGNPDALASGLRRLTAEDAVALGPRAAAVARAEFDPQRCAQQWLAQVERLL